MHTSPGVTRPSVAPTGRLIVAVSVVLSSLASGVASAAPRSAIDLPRGLYCSCPPTTAQGSRSVMPAVARLPYVDGILVRVSWADLAPALGAYRWELLDRELAQAQDYGKKVALAVVNGPLAPAWLAARGRSDSRIASATVPRRCPCLGTACISRPGATLLNA